jgi:small-conductance mechanosensitive channel
MATPLTARDKLRKLAGPLLLSGALGALLYVGGDTSQAIGLEAFRTTRLVLGFLLGMATILSLAVLVNRFLRYVVLEGVAAPALGSAVPQLLVQLTAAVVYSVAFAAIAGVVFHQDLSVLLAASGVFGLVFGMAIRELILDTFTGLALNLDRPIRIGDDIQLHRAGDATIEGRVLEISWRTARILDRNGNVVVVANSRLAGYTITNFSMPQPHARTVLTLTLDHAVPPERGLRILTAAALDGQQGHVLPDAPPPRALIGAITPHGVEYMVECFPTFAARLVARSAVLLACHRHLAQAGIQPAWPKRTQADASTGSGLQPQPDPARLAALLGATGPFQDLAPEDLVWMVETAALRSLPAAGTLVQAGEAAAAMFLVVEGLLSAQAPRHHTGQPPPTLLGPGVLIGAHATLSGDTYRRTIRARTDALLCEIDLRALSRLLDRRPDASGPISRRAAEEYATGEAAAGRGNGIASADLAGDIDRHLRRIGGRRATVSLERGSGVRGPS